MQEKFKAADHEETVYAVLKAIADAKASDMDIIVVEYSTDTWGNTLDVITDAIGCYDKLHYVAKDRNDGGLEVEVKLQEQRLHGSELLVCGIEIAFCINETITTLINKFEEKITIIKEACWCSRIRRNVVSSREEAFAYRDIYTHPNVTMI